MALFCGLDGIHETAVGFLCGFRFLEPQTCVRSYTDSDSTSNKNTISGHLKCKYELSDSVNSSGSAVKGSQGNGGEGIGVVVKSIFWMQEAFGKVTFSSRQKWTVYVMNP